MNATPLHTIATGRLSSLFDVDVALLEEKLQHAISGKRILVVGGAGSIGSSTVLQLITRMPKALHVIDQNENGLAELVRQLRSRPSDWSVKDFQALPLDYGSAAARHFLYAQQEYDLVLNFAALKHVRSEKDPFSTLQMFETNLVKQVRLMTWLAERGFAGRLFTVSTDKAANPSSMMGATKRVMEHVLFSSSAARALSGPKSSARFANVAFSNGSLLQGFQNRLARGEPLAAPIDTRRYFVSLAESGQICAIASTVVPDMSIVIPKLNPNEHLILLHDIAERFLKWHGFSPAIYQDEKAACANVENERSRGRWPLLLTPLDTAGEKPYEEFTTAAERRADLGLPNLETVEYDLASQAAVDQVVAEVCKLLEDPKTVVSKDLLKEIIAIVEPGFLETHRDSKTYLDQRL
ncbi:polysaccharide biosynthesis protein [Rhizobium sp. S96]|uniref:polysaccharide biosynthesis protein n=1 Tax=Rhizobium sp. S96 TaxID=3055140 RepID=UPI0025AB450A|nr:polysaccharide biosynthesis protein [Rhizobium sp. S96]MDM9620893.1 polysaccharide biosynthesis protein [Rhizobium sp. S96]